jgi:carboxymethylenebutenolidase
MDIYVSKRETKEKLPVVIVLMEAFGVNSHIQSICDRLADEGFLAAAPDLFHRLGRRLEIPYGDRKLIMPYLGKMTNEGILQDVRETINFLENLPTADIREINTLGFCIGGFASVLCGSKLSIRKMVSFYGAGMVHPREGIALTPFLSSMGAIKSKCLFFFGGQDASIPQDDIHEIEKKLTASKVSYDVTMFPKSDHGFFCDERKSYNPEDAAVAWKKTIDFLKSS